MKRQTLCIVIGISLSIAAVSCADRTAATKPTDAGMTAAAKGKPGPASFEFEGTIDKIDADNGSITVQHWPLSKKFRVPPECEIDVFTNANATLAQLKVNDPVVVAYSEVGKDLVANRIRRRGKAYEQEQREKMERLNDMLYPSPNQ
jgi:Cu/Ag efflux protein CusF